jgi:carbonic anhydrase
MSRMLDLLLDANRRVANGEEGARVDFPDGGRPFVITCMDPRLAGVMIPAMGLAHDPPPQARFAGGVILPDDPAVVRSVLAAGIFNLATEVLVVGHTDCRMGQVGRSDVLNGLKRLRVDVAAFGGQDPMKFLGAFAAERASVISSVATLRADPRMPASMPVHGLIYNIESRRLELIESGYDVMATTSREASIGASTGFPSMAGLGAPPAPAYGAPSMQSGPVSMFGTGPVSFGTLPQLGAIGPVPGMGEMPRQPFHAPPPPPPALSPMQPPPPPPPSLRPTPRRVEPVVQPRSAPVQPVSAWHVPAPPPPEPAPEPERKRKKSSAFDEARKRLRNLKDE